MIKNIFFDFDGTLADTSDAIIKTTFASFDSMGMVPPTADQIRQCIGLSLKSACRLYPGMMGDSSLDEQSREAEYLRNFASFEDAYHRFFDEFATNNVHLYPGVKDVLNSLKNNGYRLAIATSRGRRSLEHLLDVLGIADCFEAYATVECAQHHKPAPDTVLYLFDLISGNPDETLVVGDTVFDLQMGQNASCHVCGVSYGNHSAEMLQSVSPDAVIDDFRKLPEVVRAV